MIPLWKGKNPIYFGVIAIIPFDNLYRRAYFVMHTFLVDIFFFSLHSNSQLDINIKGHMIKDLFNIAGFRLPDKTDVAHSSATGTNPTEFR